MGLLTLIGRSDSMHKPLMLITIRLFDAEKTRIMFTVIMDAVVDIVLGWLGVGSLSLDKVLKWLGGLVGRGEI